MVLDVKQQEQYLGACGYMMATALKDQVAPMIASAHALSFVTSYFKPSEWHIYKNNNLVLFIPKCYLREHGITSPALAGFDLTGWTEFHPGKDQLSGSEFYSMLNDEQVDFLAFDDLSKRSTDVICSTLKKNTSNRWKIYAVGHGAPDAYQVCGLNLNDFRNLLSMFENNITTDFFIYQTCFGGSKNQLKAVYGIGQDTFSKFSFPIISGSLTNSVSFGAHPSQGTTFKGLFSKVNNSMIVENKMRRLLKAVNEINKCLDYAGQMHWTNNMLLVRMPGSEYFEPVVDNKSVFKASSMPEGNAKMNAIYADKDLFKCVLLDKPIIQHVVDLNSFANFVVASGISRSKHFVQELILPVAFNDAQSKAITVANIAELFSSLAFPQKSKTFFIETLKIADNSYNKVTITQVENGTGYAPKQTISICAFSQGAFYKGMLVVALDFAGKPFVQTNTIALANENEGKWYAQEYALAVDHHLSKKHPLPLHITQEVFMVV